MKSNCRNAKGIYAGRIALITGLVLLFCMLGFASALADVLTLPAALTAIEDEAFMNDASITSVVIPEGTVSIGARAFAGCSNLETVTIPDSVTSIEVDAFMGCTRLFFECNTGSIAAAYAQVNAINHSGEDTSGGIRASGSINSRIHWTLYYSGRLCVEGTGAIPNYQYPVSGEAPWYNYREEILTVEVGEGITSVGNYAFCHEKYLKSISLPSTLTSMGGGIFAGCFELKYCNVPDRVSSMSWDVFYDCRGCTSVHMPAGISSISSYVFYNCTSLRAVYIGPRVTYISSSAFNECSDKLTIYGEAGSYAQTFARNNGYAFSTEPFPGTENEDEIITLSGRVTLADGTPIENAYIYVMDDAAEETIAFAYTDKNGDWDCEVIPESSYTVYYLHDSYTITPDTCNVTPTIDTTVNTAIASITEGEGTSDVSFAIQMNGEALPTDGIMVGDKVTFSITAAGAEKVRLIVDGVAYNEYRLADGSAVVDRIFTKSGHRSVCFQAYDGSAWGKISEAQIITVGQYGVLDAPVLHSIDTQFVGESFEVSWDSVENAEAYTVYLYRDILIWPSLSSTEESTTSGLSIEIPGSMLYDSGEYVIEVIASGYGYSQATASVGFAVEDTREAAEVTYPYNGAQYNVGDTMHARYAAGNGTKSVRLLVTETMPDGSEEWFAPGNDDVFYPVAKNVGTYILTPYYSYGEGEFTKENADGAGDSVTVSVAAPKITSLIQGPNKEFAIGYTDTMFEFTGKVSNKRYTVKVYLNGELQKEITPQDGSFTYAVNGLESTGKYEYMFVPCYGKITGKSIKFPIYEVNKAKTQSDKYAAERIELYAYPGASAKSPIPYGTPITILGEYQDIYLYVSAGNKMGVIAADNNLADAVTISEMEINVTCLEENDLPYNALNTIRKYRITAPGAVSISADVDKPNGETVTYCGVLKGDAFLFEIPIDQTGGYTCTFSAMDSAGGTKSTEKHTFVGVDTTYEYAGQECWSVFDREISTQGFGEGYSEIDTIDVISYRLYCVGKLNNEQVYVHGSNSSVSSDEYAIVKRGDIQFEKNTTTYRVIYIVNPYENGDEDDRSKYNLTHMQSLFHWIPEKQQLEIKWKNDIVIDEGIKKIKTESDYNDISYIYWSGHGIGTSQNPAYSWGILPKIDKDVYSDYSYSTLCVALGDWLGKINIIIDTCYSGGFVKKIDDAIKKDSFLYPEKLAILMSTGEYEEGLRDKSMRNKKIGGRFTYELQQYAHRHSGDNLKLSALGSNVNVEGEWVKLEGASDKIFVEPTTTIWGDPNRIFFAEDPDAVK